MTYKAEIIGFRRTPLGITYYTVKITDSSEGGRSWVVERRFKDFVSLRSVLIRVHPEKRIPELPSKSFVAYFAPDSYLESRAEALNRFLSGLLSTVEPDPQSLKLRSFLNILRPHIRTAPLDCQEDEDMRIPSDAIVGILSYLVPGEVLRIGLVNRSFHRASCSPSLWLTIYVRSDKFERIQKGFLTFMARTGIAEHVESLTAQVQFSNDLGYNLSLSLPGDIHFTHLKKFAFSSLHALPQAAQSSTRILCQEFLEAVYADSAPIEFLSLEIEVTNETLKTVLGIAKQCKLRVFHLTFLGSPVDISENDFEILCDIISAVEPWVESLRIKVKYPESWTSEQLGPDSYFGERIGHYRGQPRLTRFLLGSPGAFPQLTVIEFPFLSYSEVMKLDKPKFPTNVEEVRIRAVVDGIGKRATIDRSNRSLVHDMFGAVNFRCRVLKISTIGGDEQDMHQTYLVPYIFSQQAMNFEQFSETWLNDWRQRLCNLERLVIAGPCTGISKLVGHFIKSNLFATFLAIFPRLIELEFINNISAFDDDSVIAITQGLPVVNKLVLCGRNELLTDRLLVSLATNLVHRRTLRVLRLPRTRYMSYIGIEAIQRLLISKSSPDVIVVDEEVETGRRAKQ